MKAIRSAVVTLMLTVVVLGLPAPAFAAATINVWYGLNQDLALPGAPQNWFDIPGNVSGASSLSYRLNGGASVDLTISDGGSTSRRLENPGDFNIDLAVSSLNPGPNTVVITANDGTTATVTVNYTPPGGTWPIPSTIDWSDYSAGCVVGQPCGNINDAAQVVDGTWQLTANGVRTLDTGYDRAIAVGDKNWTEYEVSAPVTIHSLNNDAKQGIPGGVGFLVGWKGHTDDPVSCGQPKCGWLPLGAIGYHRTNQVLELWDDTAVMDSTPRTLVEGETYIFKMKVEASPDANPGNVFSFKVWDADLPDEPDGWDLVEQEAAPHNGSVLLLSHYNDVTFGDITFCPVGGCPAAGPLAIDDGKLVADLGSIDIDVIANDLPGDAPIDRSTVTVVDDPAFGTTSVDPVTGVITYTHTDTGSTPDTFTYTVADTDTITSNEAQVTVYKKNLAFESDEFNAPLLDDRWTWVPVDAGTSHALVGAGTGDAHLAISTGTTAHNQFVPTGPNVIDEAPRVMQSVVADIAFEIEAKFNAEPTGGFNDQGLLIEQDPSRWLRFDTYHSGTQLRAFVGDTNGTTQAKIDVPIPTGSGLYLRVRRIGNAFTFEHSADGAIWNVAGTVTSALTVNSAGVFAANPNGGNFTAEVDYVFNTIAGPGPLTADPVDLDFAEIAVGTTSAPLSVELTNTGATAVTITGAAIDGVHSADFQIVTPPTSPLAPGASTTVEVTLSPGDEGTRTASLDITHEGGDDGLVALPLTGEGIIVGLPVDSETLAIGGAAHIGVLFVDPITGTTWVDVRDVAAGSLVSSVPFGSNFVGADLEVVVSPTGDPELAVLGTNAADAVRVTVKDSVTGALVGRANYGDRYSGDDLEIVAGDLAVLGTDPGNDAVRVRTRTIADTAVGDAHLGNAFSGEDLEVNGSNVGVLGTRSSNLNVRVRTMNPASGAKLNTAYWGNADTALDVEVLGSDWAVLQERLTNGAIRVQTRTPAGAKVAKAVFGVSPYVASDLEIAGSDVAVLQTSTANQAVRVQTRTPAGVLMGTAQYGTAYSGVDLEVIGTNLAVLGVKASNGKVRDQLRTVAGTLLATIDFS